MPSKLCIAILNAGRSGFLFHSNKKADSGWINRFLVLETRACLRISPQQSLYLPAIFLIFSLVAGNLIKQLLCISLIKVY